MSNWSFSTRSLHFSVAITVTMQLMVSLLMERPEPGEQVSPLAAFFGEVHETIGVVAVLAIFAHLFWLFIAKDTGFHHLFLWGKGGRSQVVDDIKQLKTKQPLKGGPGSARMAFLPPPLGA